MSGWGSYSRPVLLVAVALVATLVVLPAGIVLEAESAAWTACAPAAGGAQLPAISALADAATPFLTLAGEARHFAVPVAANVTEATAELNAPGLPVPSHPTAAGSTSLVSRRASETLAASAPAPSQDHVPADAIYPPNPRLESSPLADPADAVGPSYQTTPAPMGLADYGLGPGGSTYTVYASAVLGTVQLNEYNATAGPLYEDTGANYWDYGNPYANVTPWQSSVQLNTVVANVSYPGADNGSFWAQNVVNFQGPYLRLVDNVWNFSNPYDYFGYGTLYSYGGVPGYEFYYDDGPTLPAAYPLTIQLYNNATLVDGRSAITFAYRVTEPGRVYTGTYDEVVFNSTPTPSDPLLTPAYLVSGTNLTPAGLLYDAELVFGGPGSGSNAVVTSLNGSETLNYLVGGDWRQAQATYDYGTDTAETSVGVAGWYSGTTEFVNQGPSMLYGLWNATGGVPAGNIAVHLALDPTYQFVFIAADGTNLDNESYAPSTAAGTVQTWLPPGVYNISGWADGFDTWTGQFDSSVDGTLALSSNPGVWDAPVYLNGAAQAEALGTDATGWSGAGPVSFTNLTINVSLIFNHLNDYGYTEFALVWAYGFASPGLYISNITQGSNVAGETLYILDAPGQVANIPELGDSIEAWDVSAPRFADLNLSGVEVGEADEQGGAVAVWNAPGASAFRVNSTNGSLGFWAANSPNVSDTNSSSTLDGFALSLMASPGATGINLSSNYFGYTVLSDGSDHGSFVNLQEFNYSVGYTSFASNDTNLTSIVAEIDSTGVDAQYAIDDRVTDLFANSSSLGLFGLTTGSLTISDVNVSTGPGEIITTGIDVYGGNWTNITGLGTNASWGVEFLGGANESLSDVNVTNNSLGAFFIETGAATIDNFTSVNSLGIFVEDNLAPVLVDGVFAYDGGVGLASFLSSGINVSDIVAYGGYWSGVTSLGAEFADSTASTVAGVTANYRAVGVNVTDSSDTTVTDISASNAAPGVVVDASSGVFVTDGQALDTSAVVVASQSSDLILTDLSADDGYGAILQGSSLASVTNTIAIDRGVGVLEEQASDVNVNSTTASGASVAVELLKGSDLWVNGTTVTNRSIGVAVDRSDGVRVSGVWATNASVVSPYASWEFGFPTAAVVTESTAHVAIAGVWTTDYPAAVYDNASEGLVLTGVNATRGDFGVILNGTDGGLLDDLSLVADGVGLELNDGASLNEVTQSRFVDNIGFGVLIQSGSENQIDDNSFLGNNGAGSTYNATHVQAYSDSKSNAFNNTEGVGNYWADWHEYDSGELAPYFVGMGTYDYHPLGAPEGSFRLVFTATGLPADTNWSVTVGSVTESSTGPSIGFVEAPGSYSYSVGAQAGYAVSPASGAAVIVDGAVTIDLAFSPLYEVSFVATGDVPSAPWTVYLDGDSAATSGSAVSFNVTAGTYQYTVVAPSGWTASPAAGSVDVAGAYTVPVTFASTAPDLTTVTVEEQGLSGVGWNVLFGGVAYPSDGTSATFTVASGTYAFQIEPVPGYTVSEPAGTVTISGSSYLLLETFTQVVYPVTFAATGLGPATVWSVSVNGEVYTSSAASITLMLPNGTVAYTFESVAGYSIDAAASTGRVAVAGGPTDVTGAYAFDSTSAFSLDAGDAVAIGIAIGAFVVGCVALLRPPRRAARARAHPVPTQHGGVDPGAPRSGDGDSGA